MTSTAFVQTCLRDAARGLEMAANALKQIEKIAAEDAPSSATKAAEQLRVMIDIYEADGKNLSEMAERRS